MCLENMDRQRNPLECLRSACEEQNVRMRMGMRHVTERNKHALQCGREPLS